MGRALWFAGGLAFRSFRRAPLAMLFVAMLVLAVVQGWFEPWDATQDRQPQTTEAP